LQIYLEVCTSCQDNNNKTHEKPKAATSISASQSIAVAFRRLLNSLNTLSVVML